MLRVSGGTAVSLMVRYEFESDGAKCVADENGVVLYRSRFAERWALRARLEIFEQGTEHVYDQVASTCECVLQAYVGAGDGQPTSWWRTR